MDAPMPNLEMQSEAQNVNNNEPEPPVKDSSENSEKEVEEKKAKKNRASRPSFLKAQALKIIQEEIRLCELRNIEKSLKGGQEKTNVLNEYNYFASNHMSTDYLTDILMRKRSKHTIRTLDIPNNQNKKVKWQFQILEASDFQEVISVVEEIFPNSTFDIKFLSFILIWNTCIDHAFKCITTDESAEINDKTYILCFAAFVDISHDQTLEIYSQIKNDLKALANEYATDATNAKVKEILENKYVPIELIISYRRVNEKYLTTDFSLMLMKRGINKIHYRKLPISVRGYFVYVCKKLKVTNKCTKKNEFIWLCSEEKILAEEALYSFQYPIKSELLQDKLQDLSLDGNETVIPYRQVLIFESIQLQELIFNLGERKMDIEIV